MWSPAGLQAELADAIQAGDLGQAERLQDSVLLLPARRPASAGPRMPGQPAQKTKSPPAEVPAPPSPPHAPAQPFAQQVQVQGREGLPGAAAPDAAAAPPAAAAGRPEAAAPASGGAGRLETAAAGLEAIAAEHLDRLAAVEAELAALISDGSDGGGGGGGGVVGAAAAAAQLAIDRLQMLRGVLTEHGAAVQAATR
eukprot:SAG22_NODE_3607_length_1618_cov_1.930876_1_plen_196_part_10